MLEAEDAVWHHQGQAPRVAGGSAVINVHLTESEF